MNFEELRARTQALCWAAGWADVQPPPNWGLLVREGHRKFFWEAQCLTSDQTLTTVVDQEEYSLTAPPDWVLVTEVLYGTTSWLMQTTEVEIARYEPLWTQTSSSTPTHWWVTDTNKIRVYPAPDTAGVTMYVHGVRLDTDLSSNTDAPSCPAIFHEAIALFAAWYHGKVYARGEDFQVLNGYYKEAMELVGRLREFVGGQDLAAFTRNVAPRRVPYVSLGIDTGR